jgi:serine protease Do
MSWFRVRNTVPALAIVAVLWATPTSIPAKDSPATALQLARSLNQAFIDVAEQASSSVVVIMVAHRRPIFDLDDQDNPFWDMIPRQFRKQFEEEREKLRKSEKEPPAHREPVFDGKGSGVVVREDGYIMTNRHVVDGADKIIVRLRDGTEFPAEVRGVDSRSDVAVIKVDPKGKKLATARLGNSDNTRVGEFAIAIGAPFELDYSVTFGHVSAKGRSRIIPDPAMDQDFIQTDANINPGNSGGPLVNIEGEIIGINTLIRGIRSGIGFAIPINLAREIGDKLISDGKFTRSWLGVGIRALSEDPELRDLLSGITEGLVVTQIQPESPAAHSDLKPTDIITAVDGKSVSTGQQLKNEIRSKKVGQLVTLDVHRHGKNIKVKVKTEAWPDDPVEVVLNKPREEETEPAAFGMKVGVLTKELAEQYEIDRADGVIITEIEKGSVADKKDFRAGDIITEINHQRVATPKQFGELMKSANHKKGVIINFITRGTSKFQILKESGE